MKLIVCLDDNNGMQFNGRRQSRDRAVTQRIAEMTRYNKLWIRSKSAKLFDGACDNLNVDDDFLQKAQSGDYCFLEDLELVPSNDQIEEITVFRWNRIYPADVVFPVVLPRDGWRKVDSAVFPGYSHETITQEVYIREE